jgi:acyl carrier protein
MSEEPELSTLAGPTAAGVGEFIVGALREMHYDVSGTDEQTPLGPTGLDLGSLAVVELSYRLDVAYHAVFNEEDMEQLAVMTIGDLVDKVIRRSALNG